MSSPQTFPRRALRRHRPARAQRGVVMFVAMIVLIVMTLAGLAMLRQMGSTSAIAGNLAFKRGATSSADLGVETARQWLTATGNLGFLNTGSSTNTSYFPTWGAAPGGASTGLLVNEVDPTTGNWPAVWSTLPVIIDPVTNDSIRYVIQRLCAQPLAPDAAGQDCVAAPGKVVGKGGPNGTPQPSPTPTPYYRVTTQVSGARNTVSYTQVVLGS